MKLLSISAWELKNSQKVYLYNVEGHWYAFDRSVLDLIDICPVLLCSNTEMVLERI